jgi:undecaprenyl-diphosphatase
MGNCRYHPRGFAPRGGERLDDGQLDVRIVDGDSPFSRTRLLLAVLTGRLGRTRVYSQRLASELQVRSLDGPLRLARDGETFEGSVQFTVSKSERPLPVFLPKPQA